MAIDGSSRACDRELPPADVRGSREPLRAVPGRHVQQLHRYGQRLGGLVLLRAGHAGMRHGEWRRRVLLRRGPDRYQRPDDGTRRGRCGSSARPRWPDGTRQGRCGVSAARPWPARRWRGLPAGRQRLPLRRAPAERRYVRREGKSRSVRHLQPRRVDSPRSGARWRAWLRSISHGEQHGEGAARQCELHLRRNAFIQENGASSGPMLPWR
jgi:hypothetical protein